MSCPHRREVLMVFCSASPVRKLLPADQLVPTGPCACGSYERCPIYQEAAGGRRRRGAERCPLEVLTQEEEAP
jgi:hypothetical protein